jgi:plasmid stabilization system protein ParE
VTFGFHPAAEAEHLEHVAWFEDQQAGLGQRFLAAVESTIDRACAAPRRYRVVQPPDVRRVAVPGFPYELLFRAVSDNVQILAVAHFRRRPGYWLPRLD